jgi:hypothetical protein
MRARRLEISEGYLVFQHQQAIVLIASVLSAMAIFNSHAMLRELRRVLSA